MVIEEKGLLSAMKDAYKTDGYKVAVEDSADIENVIISTSAWTVVILKKELPRKVLGLIAEHIGEIPKPGTAYQVKKKETQTEIFDLTMQTIRDFRISEQDRRIIRRTSLLLGGSPLWQTATDQKVVKVYPDYEDIISWGNNVVRLVGDDMLLIDGTVSRGYIRCQAAKDGPELQRLSHLAKIQWVAE